MTYSIKVTPNYYQGTLGAPQESYLMLRDIDVDNQYPDDIAEWDTEEEAQEVIDGLTDGTYYLSHGEAGRPNYDIVEDHFDGEEVLTAYENPTKSKEIG
jgi:phage/plasmid-associated DNA primase